MREVSIRFDLFCAWFAGKPEAYRVYLDSDLVTERTYIWNNWKDRLFLQENIIANLYPGEHYVRIEPVNPKFDRFVLKNLVVDNNTLPDSSGHFIIT
jgi:hypothetical protein